MSKIMAKNLILAASIFLLYPCNVDALDVQINNNTSKYLLMHLDLSAQYDYDEQDQGLYISEKRSPVTSYARMITIKPGSQLYVQSWGHVTEARYATLSRESIVSELTQKDREQLTLNPTKLFALAQQKAQELLRKGTIKFYDFNPRKMIQITFGISTKEKNILATHDDREILTINANSIRGTGEIDFEALTQPEIPATGPERPWLLLGVKPDADFENILRIKQHTDSPAIVYQEELEYATEVLHDAYDPQELGPGEKHEQRILKMHVPTFTYRRTKHLLSRDDFRKINGIVDTALRKAQEKFAQKKLKKETK